MSFVNSSVPKKKPVLKITAFLFSFTLLWGTEAYANPTKRSGLGTYEEAYRIEKQAPVFAIPLYERIAKSQADPKVRETALQRLYFLYKRYNRTIDLLLFPRLFSTKIGLGKERKEILELISKSIGQPLPTVEEVFALSQNPNTENIQKLQIVLLENRSKSLFEFSFSIHSKLKNFSQLSRLISNLPIEIVSIPLRVFILSKEAGSKFMTTFYEETGDQVLTENEQSDLLFYYANWFRSKNSHAMAGRYYLMSAVGKNQARGYREAGKTLITLGLFQEACELNKYSANTGYEAEETLYQFCMERDMELLKQVRVSLQILSETEGGAFYEQILQSLP